MRIKVGLCDIEAALPPAFAATDKGIPFPFFGNINFMKFHPN